MLVPLVCLFGQQVRNKEWQIHPVPKKWFKCWEIGIGIYNPAKIKHKYEALHPVNLPVDSQKDVQMPISLLF